MKNLDLRFLWAKIYLTSFDHEILHYEDDLTCYQYDFTTHEVIMNDLKKSYKKRSSVNIQLK